MRLDGSRHRLAQVDPVSYRSPRASPGVTRPSGHGCDVVRRRNPTSGDEEQLPGHQFIEFTFRYQFIPSDQFDRAAN